ncbi:unnamed protein product, partial [Rotaria sordida]
MQLFIHDHQINQNEFVCQINTYPYHAIRILEILLKRSIQDRIKIVSNKCYFFDEPSEEFNNGFEKRHEWQIYDEPMSESQTDDVDISLPEQRYYDIINIINI